MKFFRVKEYHDFRDGRVLVKRELLSKNRLDTGEWVETTCNPADVQDLKADDIVYVWKKNNKVYFQIEEV